MRKIVVAEKIFTGECWLEQVALVVENGMVTAILNADEVDGSEVLQMNGSFLVPAFIDLQIYGANNKLLAVQPTSEALSDLYDYCKAGGAALFQPTVATNSNEVFFRCIDAVREYWKTGGRGCIGLHLEGPWISREKRGAHLQEHIHAPTVKEVTELLNYGQGVISMITLAPEVCSPEIIAKNGIVISAGHSNCFFNSALQSFDLGITTITHLFNAMSPLQHREPGLVGAAFRSPKVKASIIPDGYHVDFEVISIAKELMGERLFAITDAVTETNEGGYPHQFDGDKYLSEGILSGSALTMHTAFRNLVQKVGIAVEESIRMCSLYPAMVIKLDHLHGKIAPDYAAQFLALDDQLNLVETIILQ